MSNLAAAGGAANFASLNGQRGTAIADSSSASDEAIPYSNAEDEEAKTEATLYAIPKTKRFHDKTLDCKQRKAEAASTFWKIFHIWSSSVRPVKPSVNDNANGNAATPLRQRKKWRFRSKLFVGKQKPTLQPPLPPSSSEKHLPQIPLAVWSGPHRTTIKQRPLPPTQPCIEPTINQQTPMLCLQSTQMQHNSPHHQVAASYRKVSPPVARQQPQPQQMMQPTALPLKAKLSSPQAPHRKPLLWALPRQSARTPPISVPESPPHGRGNCHSDESHTMSAKSLMVPSSSENNIEDCKTHWVCLPYGESSGAEAGAALLSLAVERTSIQFETIEASLIHQGSSENRSSKCQSKVEPEVFHARSGICDGRKDNGGCDKNLMEVKPGDRVPQGFGLSRAAAIKGDANFFNSSSSSNSSNSSSSSSSCLRRIRKASGAVDAGDKQINRSRSTISSSHSSNSGGGSSTDSSFLHFGVNPHDFPLVSDNPFKVLRSG